jgi:hypothetical protein
MQQYGPAPDTMQPTSDSRSVVYTCYGCAPDADADADAAAESMKVLQARRLLELKAALAQSAPNSTSFAAWTTNSYPCEGFTPKWAYQSPDTSVGMQITYPAVTTALCCHCP